MAADSKKMKPIKIEPGGKITPDMSVEDILKSLRIKFSKFITLLNAPKNAPLKSKFYNDHYNSLAIEEQAWINHCNRMDRNPENVSSKAKSIFIKRLRRGKKERTFINYSDVLIDKTRLPVGGIFYVPVEIINKTRKGIPLQNPIFCWDDWLGPKGIRNAFKKSNHGPPKVGRAELLIARGKMFWYGRIVNGELEAYSAVKWRDELWKPWLKKNKDKIPSQWSKIKPGASFNASPFQCRKVADLAKQRKRMYFIPGETYKVWVDFFLLHDNDAILVPGHGGIGVRNEKREHFIGDKPWAPPLPHEDHCVRNPKNWQVIKIPRKTRNGKRPVVLLKCRRYAFLPRLNDWVYDLSRIQDRIAKYYSKMGAFRSFTQCLSDIAQSSIDLNLNYYSYVAAQQNKKPGLQYATMLVILRDMLIISEFYILENEYRRRQVNLANVYAAVIFHTITKNKTFLDDFNYRDLHGLNSDLIRDMKMLAHTTLIKTPPPVYFRYLKKDEIIFNEFVKNQIIGYNLKKYPDKTLGLYKNGQISKVKAYWFGDQWDKTYFEKVFKPFINAAKDAELKSKISEGQKKKELIKLEENLKPLFASRENLIFIIKGLGPRVYKELKLIKESWQLFIDQGLVKDIRFDEAIKSDPSELSLSKGGAKILATTGLTFMFKGLVLWNAWDKKNKSTKDKLDAIQKTVDFASETASLVGEVMELTGDAKNMGRLGVAGKVVQKGGAVLAVLADGIDTGLFIYYDMFEEEGIKERKIKYEDSYNTKCLGYNLVIAGGKAVSTVGSAFMCSVVGAPIGIILKAISISLINLTELVKEIDGIGEEEKKLFKKIWTILTIKRTKEFRETLNFYNYMVQKHSTLETNKWDVINKMVGQLDGNWLFDDWNSIGPKKIKEIRYVFNIVNKM